MEIWTKGKYNTRQTIKKCSTEKLLYKVIRGDGINNFTAMTIMRHWTAAKTVYQWGNNYRKRQFRPLFIIHKK